MALYEIKCPTHGEMTVQEPIAKVMAALSNGWAPFHCPLEECYQASAQVFKTEHVHHARIEDMESIGRDRRGIDQGVNLGLPGKFVEIGKHQDGRPRMAYEPTRSADASSIAKAKEIARRAGLTPADTGRFRSTR